MSNYETVCHQAEGAGAAGLIALAILALVDELREHRESYDPTEQS